MPKYLKDESSSSQWFFFLLFLRLVLPVLLGFCHFISALVLKAEQELIVGNLSQNLKVDLSPVVSSNQAWNLFWKTWLGITGYIRVIREDESQWPGALQEFRCQMIGLLLFPSHSCYYSIFGAILRIEWCILWSLYIIRLLQQ